MDTSADVRNLQAAYNLKQALSQTDNRLFGSQEGNFTQWGSGSLPVNSLLPVISTTGKGYFRSIAKNRQLVMKVADAQPDTIVAYPNQTGITEYGQVVEVNLTNSREKGVYLKPLHPAEATNILKTNPHTKRITLTEAAKINLLDRLFAPLDWLLLLVQNSPLGKWSEKLTSQRALTAYVVLGVVVCFGFLTYAFYLISQ